MPSRTCPACRRSTARVLCELCRRSLPPELLDLGRRSRRNFAWLAAAVAWLHAMGRTQDERARLPHVFGSRTQMAVDPLSEKGRAWFREVLQTVADTAGHMADGPVPHIRRYVGPDAGKCVVCGRPWCAPDSPMFRECEQAYDSK